MNRRIGFLGIVLIFIAALTGFYIYLKKQQATASSAFSAIPINAAIVIDIPNPIELGENLANKNKFSNELFDFKELTHFKEELSQLDTIILNHQLKSKLFHDNGLLISFHELGQKKFKPIFYTLLGGRFEGNQLIKTIEAYFETIGSVNFSRYSQVRLFKFTPADNPKATLFYAYHKGIFILSPSEILIQDAIRQTDSDVGLTQQPHLTKLRSTAGNYADANIFIQFSEFRKMLGRIINEDAFRQIEVRDFSEWGELDFNLKNSTLLFNGFSTSKDKTARVTKVFKGQTPQNIKFVKYIPNVPEAFNIIGISDVKLFRQNLGNYMEDIGQKERFDINEQSVRNAFGNQAVIEIEKLTQNELAMVTLADGTSLFAMQTKGFRNSQDLIESFFKTYCKNNNRSIKDFKKDYKIDSDTEFPIYKMPINKLPTRLFGPWFNACEAEYLGVFDKYMIFSDNYKSLTNFIYNNVLQKTIAYNGSYKEFENFLSGKVNFYQFVNLAGTGKYLEHWLTPASFKYLQNNQEKVKEFYGMAYQFSTDNDYIYNSLIFRHQPGNTFRASTEWESRLDTSIRFKPALVRNHYTGEKEVFVQDENNTIYLINKAGRILWKHRFNERIMGQIHQVDYFKNGKLQILFNTKSQIHLIDRNGNYVERYPVTLNEKANAPLAIFDYENRKNYRIFIPSESKKIYCYNIEGKSVAGFNFSGSDFLVTKPVQYFRNNSKDYLVVMDENRTYILDRKGNERLKLKKQFVPSLKNQYTYQQASGNKAAHLVTTDREGKIVNVFFDGKVEELEIERFEKGHFFNLQDIDVDGLNEYIIVNENKLIVYNQLGKKLFDFKFSTNIEHSPSFYKFSTNRIGIGITEAAKNRIYLFDAKGQMFDGFPLKGHTRFSVGLLSPAVSRFNLLVGGDDNYLYNYKLN